MLCRLRRKRSILNTKKELEAMLVGMLAGRAAEEIVFDTVTTGASNDIEKATQGSQSDDHAVWYE